MTVLLFNSRSLRRPHSRAFVWQRTICHFSSSREELVCGKVYPQGLIKQSKRHLLLQWLAAAPGHPTASPAKVCSPRWLSLLPAPPSLGVISLLWPFCHLYQQTLGCLLLTQKLLSQLRIPCFVSHALSLQANGLKGMVESWLFLCSLSLVPPSGLESVSKCWIVYNYHSGFPSKATLYIY